MSVRECASMCWVSPGNSALDGSGGGTPSPTPALPPLAKVVWRFFLGVRRYARANVAVSGANRRCHLGVRGAKDLGVFFCVLCFPGCGAGGKESGYRDPEGGMGSREEMDRGLSGEITGPSG